MAFRLITALALALAAPAACSDNDNNNDNSDSGDTTATDSVSPSDSNAAADTAQPSGLQLGALYPQRGPLGFLGDAVEAALGLAVADINAAGGVLGEDVTLNAQTTWEPPAASVSVQALIDAGVPAVVGPSTSSTGFAVLDALTAAEIVTCTPSATAPPLGADDDGYFFRSVADDGRVGALIVERAVAVGQTKITIVRLADPYAVGVGNAIKATLSAGSGELAGEIVLPDGPVDVAKVLSDVRATTPDAVVLLVFDPIDILAGMLNDNLSPAVLPTYITDASFFEELPEVVSADSPGSLAGLTAVFAAAGSEDAAFNTALGAAPHVYAANAYDCAVAIALAAEKAGSLEGSAIRDTMQDVTGGGTACASFAACKALLDAGTDIDYDGVSGPIDFNADGEPGKARFEVRVVADDGTFPLVETVMGEL